MEKVLRDPWRELGRRAVYAAFAEHRLTPNEATRCLMAMDLEVRHRHAKPYPPPMLR